MRIVNEELNRLSLEIWEWTKEGRSLEDAPDDIKKKAKEYNELSIKLENEALKKMGIPV